MGFLQKMLIGKALAPVWKFLDGKKTWIGVVVSFLAIVIQLLPPDMAGIGEAIKKIIEVIIANTGADPLLTTAEVLMVVGVGHKMVKAAKEN